MKNDVRKLLKNLMCFFLINHIRFWMLEKLLLTWHPAI